MEILIGRMLKLEKKLDRFIYINCKNINLDILKYINIYILEYILSLFIKNGFFIFFFIFFFLCKNPAYIRYKEWFM